MPYCIFYLCISSMDWNIYYLCLFVAFQAFNCWVLWSVLFLFFHVFLPKPQKLKVGRTETLMCFFCNYLCGLIFQTYAKIRIKKYLKSSCDYIWDILHSLCKCCCGTTVLACLHELKTHPATPIRCLLQLLQQDPKDFDVCINTHQHFFF